MSAVCCASVLWICAFSKTDMPGAILILLPVPYLASINYMNVPDDFFGAVMAGKFRKWRTARFPCH
ncbi:MAG: hypothetical protein EOM73_01810 [Bacteroidia bacterium]|nr:hypothetical protein [Bacteroidia bacterium]